MNSRAAVAFEAKQPVGGATGRTDVLRKVGRRMNGKIEDVVVY